MIMLWALGVPAAEPVKVLVRADQAGKPISPTLYGIFVEDINRAVDGGLYAEMIQNRSFEDANWIPGWTLLREGSAEGSMSLDTAHPLNTNNPTSLRLTIAKAGGGRVGIYSEGFKGSACGYDKDYARWEKEYRAAAAIQKVGLVVRAGLDYRLSFYARAAEGFAGPLRVSLERQDGTVLAMKEFEGLGGEWKKFNGTLQPHGGDTNARLVIGAAKPGTVWLDMVSLFPDDAVNGLWRPDLFATLKALKPGFIRFPGGCFVEGNLSLKDGWHWKETLGDPVQRPGHWDQWGYRSTDGIGLYEYLLLCEALGAKPLLVISAGIAHQEVAPMDKMGQFVQDALDAVEYANGDPEATKWGALRAKAGHPKPFNVGIVSIGNENDGPAFEERYALYYDAFRRKYPNIRLLTYHLSPGNRPVDIIDEHPLLAVPEFYYSTSQRYRGYDRKGPKIFIGESSCGNEVIGMNALHNALAEAVFLVGLPQQSDVVIMRSYAPLMCNPDWQKWNPNLIYFDAATVCGSPSYFVERMLASHRGDTSLPVESSNIPKINTHPGGRVGIGSYGAPTEYRDLEVMDRSGQTVFTSGTLQAAQLAEWEGGGDVKLHDGILRPAGGSLRALFGDRKWHDVSFALKARPGGQSTAAIFFNAQGGFFHLCEWYIRADGQSWLKFYDQTVAEAKTSFAADVWHDLRVDTADGNIRCLVDGKVVHELPLKFPALFVTANRDTAGGKIILNAVNISDEPVEAVVKLEGIGTVKPSAPCEILTGQADDRNTLSEPNQVVPKEGAIANVGPTFIHEFPARSLTVIPLEAR